MADTFPVSSDQTPAPGTERGASPRPGRADPLSDLQAARSLLDQPLLGGEPSPATAAAGPQPLQPLVWEHVVGETTGDTTDAAGDLDDASLTDVWETAPPPLLNPPSLADTPEPLLRSVHFDPPVIRQPDPEVEGLAARLAGIEPAAAPSPEPAEDRDPTPAVEAELDRLAFLPDEPVAPPVPGPVERPAASAEPVSPRLPGPAGASPAAPQAIPPAATAEPVSAETPAQPAAVSPSLPAWAAGSSPSQAPSKSAPTRPAALTYAQMAAEMTTKKRRRPRRVLSRLFTMVVVLGLVGGGLVAARTFLLEPQWADDIEPLALEVAAVRGLDFTASVPVVEVTSAVYPAKLAQSVLGLDESNVDQTAGEWRAMGLLSGVLELDDIGRPASADAPAFYDPATSSVYVLSGLPNELRTYALHRALAMALLDQQFGWSTRSAGQPQAVLTGTRMLYEADALATALSLVVESERVAISDQLVDLYTRLEATSSPSPYASTLLGRLGVAMWPWFRDREPIDRSRYVFQGLVADSTILDLRRFAAFGDERVNLDPTAVGAAQDVILSKPDVTAGSRGALYWYHVLAARVDDDLAWRSALSWQGDEVSAARISGAVCVTALFETDAWGGGTARTAFEQWAAASPEPVTMLVTERAADPSTGAPTGLQISIEVCDPGTRAVTNDGGSRLLLGGAPLRNEQFRRVIDLDPSVPLLRAACLVYGADTVSVADERGVIDSIDGWTAPAAHPPIDPLNPACQAV